MIAEFLSWWATQLRDAAPALFRAPAGGVPDALVVDARDAGLARLPLLRRRRWREQPAGVLAAGAPGGAASDPVVLRVDGALLLERMVPLPLAAEADLTRLIGYEMDRLTPFAPTDVFWSADILGRDRARGRLSVRLSLVPRAALAELLARLAQARLVPATIEVALASGQTRLIGLSHAATPADRRARRTVAALAGLAAALAVAGLAIPVVRQQAALDRIEARITQLRPAVALAEGLRRRIEAGAGGVDVIATEGARVGDALRAIALLTDVLPDDTHLTDLRLQQRKLTLDGTSAAAARLIALLSTDPAVRNPAFMAPVTRSLDGHGDQFAIRADLSP